MSSFDEILKICNRYQSRYYFVYPGIPEKTLATARNSYRIPDGERVAALMTDVVDKDGLAVAENGLYWHSRSAAYSISWEELAEVSIVKKGGFFYCDIVFSDHKAFNFISGHPAQNIILILLTELQKLALLTKLQKLAAKGGAGSDQWMVAVAGQQRGPYNVETLLAMIQSRLIDPEAALVWCEKMDQWAALREVPEFRAAAPAKRPPPLVAPPAGPTSAPPLPVASPPGAPLPKSGGPPGALVDLNTASFDQILSLPGMWVGAAAQVIEIRKQRGGFQSVDEVGHALDWPPHKVQRLAERAEVVELPRASLGAGRVVDF